MDYVVVLVAGLFAGTLGGIVGTGSSMVMMPILVVMFGPRQAVPIMAVAAIMGNMGRVMAWWREIDWRACAAYCTTAVPGAKPRSPPQVPGGMRIASPGADSRIALRSLGNFGHIPGMTKASW